MENISLVEALGISILGFTIVFVVLAVLILVVKIISSVMGEKPKAPASAASPIPSAPARTAAPAPKAAPVSASAVPTASGSAAPTAPGSAGGCELHNVDPKVAAMLMAIVADKMGVPLNELRFRSIREIT